ncbi:hypothetical protein QFZ58_006580 [Streptomyces sp. B1I3]|nr:hypothetical protein [Streptomyces sp. B1I3]
MAGGGWLPCSVWVWCGRGPCGGGRGRLRRVAPTPEPADDALSVGLLARWATSTQEPIAALRAAGPAVGCWTWWGDSDVPMTRHRHRPDIRLVGRQGGGMHGQRNSGDESSWRTSLKDPEGVRPRIFFQSVPQGKTAKNRLHLDVHTASARTATSGRPPSKRSAIASAVPAPPACAATSRRPYRRRLHRDGRSGGKRVPRRTSGRSLSRGAGSHLQSLPASLSSQPSGKRLCFTWARRCSTAFSRGAA